MLVMLMVFTTAPEFEMPVKPAVVVPLLVLPLITLLSMFNMPDKDRFVIPIIEDVPAPV